MPIKLKAEPEQTPVPSESDGSYHFLKSLKSLAPSIIRVGGGLYPGGGPIGAGLAGGAEGIAELIEDPTSLPSWKRMAVESGLGAIPFGKVLKAGKVVSSAFKSGALAGVGEGGREIAKDEDLNFPAIAAHTAIGGLTGGILSKFLGGIQTPRFTNKAEYEAWKVKEAAKTAGDFKVEPTAQTGPGTGVKNPVKKGGMVPSQAPRPIKAEGDIVLPKSTEVTARGNVPYSSEAPAPYRKSSIEKVTKPDTSHTREIMRDQKNLSDVQRWLSGKRAAEDESKMAADIQGELVEKSRSSSTTYKGEGPEGGTISSRVSYGPPEDVAKPAEFIPKTKPTIESPKAETPLGKVLKPKASRSKKTVEGFKSKVDDIANQYGEPALPPTIEPIPTPEEPPPALAQFFKTKTGATGKNYRQAQEAGIDTTEARAAHLRELAASKTGKPINVVPTPPGPTNDNKWIQDELDSIKRLKSELGELDPRLFKAITGLSGAAIGAPLGAAQADDEHKVQGAIAGGLAGGGIGMGIPAAIRGLQNPELISEGLSKFGKMIPSIQRANLLTSEHGLPANAFVGPYGSAVMGSLEKGLSGDPRGYEALKHLNPITFMRRALPKELGGSPTESVFPEAMNLIGRAEGTSLNQAATTPEKILAAPGTMMTAGDLAARKALEEGGGFLPNETREITLTSEPITHAGKHIANLSRQSPLLQFMFPFSRTTTNIAEQGAMRTPGLGFLVHNAMEKAGRTPDSMRAKLVQQGMGGATMLGSGVLGANLDPETAKIAKRYISNAAGQYSLPATIGFSAGQAYAKGKPAISGGLRELTDALPLPSTRPLQDVANFTTDVADTISGEKNLDDIRVPHSAYPAFLRELQGNELPSFGDDSTTSTQPNPSEPIIRFRRQ